MTHWDALNSVAPLRPNEYKRAPTDRRSPFDSDYERIVTCSAFRRLQDKAQVWPHDSHDFVRTRLTHTIEVAAIGEALGISAAYALAEVQKSTHTRADHFGKLVANSCMLHDIGNPPFGHAGERAIRQFFREHLKGEGMLKSLSEAPVANDLRQYEGNAQAFRIATRLQSLGRPYGLNLTSGTLACLMKYPCAASEIDGERQSRKKMGYFQADRVAFERVRANTTLKGNQRHPLTYLAEAADDIAYAVADIEDAHKKGVLEYGEIEYQLEELLDKDLFKLLVKPELIRRAETLEEERGYDYREARQLALQSFRAIAVGKMCGSCVEVFLKYFDDIVNGTFEGDLVGLMDLAQLQQALKTICVEHVFKHRQVIVSEQTGTHVIRGLMRIFLEALLEDDTPDIAKLVPKTPQHEDDPVLPDMYLVALRVADYVCGMTDRYAVRLYRQLTGVSI